ncbi:tetratricopeptide repeat protein [Kitasatospora sp. NPDC058170]|uniref:tetratricopeptide repeat protein n=1 Tax=Kitasatospora sp. NPDC058170 TaxID=3346364 RepID=UPI0036DECE60
MAVGRRGGGEAEFLADLRRLGEVHRTGLAGTHSLRVVARAVGVSPTTVGEWLKGTRVPKRPEDFLRLVAVLRKAAAQAGIELPPADRHLLDPDEWLSRYGAVARARAQSVGAGVQRAQALAALAGTESPTREPDLPDRPRPVARWTAQQLGVHPAVPGRAFEAGTGFVLPEYVERRHDRLLRAQLDAVADDGRSALIVVQGGSCTGKTRTAFEAVRASLGDWRLVFPKTAESLLTLLAADAAGPRTVLWLNEAQNVIDGPEGEAAAAALRRGLEQRGPLVIVATLWPDVHRRLAERPVEGPDRHPQARGLLASGAVVHVPGAFEDAALADLMARGDASLAVAAGASRSGGVTQVLAGGPALVDHYESAAGSDCYAWAVITAAMDARRLGHGPSVPLALLEASAPGYLTKDQRAEAPADWFADALAYARVKVKGVVAAFGEVANDHGMGARPGVCHLADYLDHYGRAARRHCFPPASFWEAVRHHAGTASDLCELARSASRRGRERVADLLLWQAAEQGHIAAWTGLVMAREYRGLSVEAERLARVALRSGDPEAMCLLAWERGAADDVAETERLCREAAETGHADALVSLALRLGGGPEAEDLLARAVEAGSSEAPHALGRLRRDAGDPEEAMRLFRIGAAAGDVDASGELINWEEGNGNQAEAERLARLHMERGKGFVLALLAADRSAAGNRADAERLSWDVVSFADRHASAEVEGPWQSGVSVATVVLLACAQEAGEARVDEVLGQLAECRSPQTLGRVAACWEDRDAGTAEKLYRRAAEAGNREALRCLARMRRGGAAETEGLLRSVADAGGGVDALAHFWEDEGRPEDAEHLMIYGLEIDGSVAEPWDMRADEDEDADEDVNADTHSGPTTERG